MGDEDERDGESGNDNDSDDGIRSKLERAVCRMSMYSTGTRKREGWTIKIKFPACPLEWSVGFGINA
jgi:hypothetical protein